MKEHYTIADVALMSGLSPRTIRNHIRMGYLTGEKIDGIWCFTSEDVKRFLVDPNVLPGIQAKKNAIVYDFMRNKTKLSAQLCIILDLPGEDGGEIANFFTQQYNQGNYGTDLRLSFEAVGNYPRLILKGQAEDVMSLLNLFFGSADTK